MLGDLFYRGASITELKNMSFHELKYWHEWHKLLSKKEAEAGVNHNG